MSKDIVGGVVCGLFMGTVFLGVLIYLIFLNRDLYDRLAKRLPPGIPPSGVMLLAVVAVPLTWGIIGAIAGALYNVAIDSASGSGLGSSNQLFTLVIICLTALVTLLTLFFTRKRKKLGWLLLIANLAFLGVFGWFLPYLGDWR